MAAKLKTNVHLLPARKAKGAGGAKRSSKPTNRLKPAPGVGVPKQPTDADVRRTTQDRLIALHTQHRAIENKMSAASEVMGGLRTKKAEIRAAIQNTCVPLAIYEELHKKLSQKTARSDNEAYEKARALAFEAFGLPCGPAAELDLQGVAEAAKPALYWRDVGYHSAVNGEFADPQRDGVPPESVQDYMGGFSEGTARNARGMKGLDLTAAPPLMVGEDPAKAAAKQAARDAESDNQKLSVAATDNNQPDWSGFDNDHTLWTEEQRATFDAWYQGLDPDADVTILHMGAEAAFDAALAAELEGPKTAAAGFSDD